MISQTSNIEKSIIIYISGIHYAIRSSLYLLLLMIDNIISSDRVSVSSEVSQYGTYIYTYIYINIFKQRYPDKKNFKSFIMPDFSWMKTAQTSSNYTVKLKTDSTLIKYD